MSFCRIDEKNNEVKTLHALIESDRLKTEKLMHDLENCRAELRDKVLTIEHMRLDINVKSDELQAMNTLKQELRDSQRKIQDLHDQQRSEAFDKTQLSLRLDQTTAALDASKQTIRELEAQIHLSKVEVNRLTQTTSELGNKADSIESLARDNEKLRIIHNKLQQDVLELNHKIHTLNKEIEHKDEDISRLSDEVKLLNQEKDLVRADLTDKKTNIDNYIKAAQHEREQRLAAEASIAEQRSQQNTLRIEMQELRNKLSSQENAASSEVEDLEDRVYKLIQSNAIARRSLLEMDDALSILLEGDAEKREDQYRLNYRLKTHAIYGTPHRPNSSIRRNHRGDSATDLLDEQESLQQFVQKGADEVRHEIAVLVERVSVKMERAVKIRSIFDSQVQKLISKHEVIVQQTIERCTTIGHRLDHCQNEANHLKSTVERDREANRHEIGEVRKLREVLLAEHTNSIREHEERYAQLLTAHEQEKLLHDQLKKRVERIQEEAEDLKNTCNRQKQELRALDNAEQLLTTFEEKMSSLAEANKALHKEMQAKDAHLHTLEQRCAENANERAIITSENEKLTIQLQAKLESLREAEDRINRLVNEIERLRARQIDPDLAAALRDSQEKLYRADQSFHSHINSSTVTSQQLSEMKEIEVSLHTFIKKSELLLSRAENIFLSASTERLNAMDLERLQRLHEDMRTLLGENHSLLHRVNAIYTSWKAESMNNSSASRSPKAIAAEIANSATASSTSRRLYKHDTVHHANTPMKSVVHSPAVYDNYTSSAASTSTNTHPNMYLKSTSKAILVPDSISHSTSTTTTNDGYFFPSRRGLMGSTNRYTLDQGGPSIELDDLRDSDDLYSSNIRTNAISTNSKLLPPRRDATANINTTTSSSASTNVGDNHNRMNRLQKIDQNLRLLTQKLDAFDMSK
jgi:DNA repair exonuclease SbcCD ATPase subunit